MIHKYDGEVKTVADLIQVLNTYPQDIPVYVCSQWINRIEYFEEDFVIEECIDIS